MKTQWHVSKFQMQQIRPYCVIRQTGPDQWEQLQMQWDGTPNCPGGLARFETEAEARAEAEWANAANGKGFRVFNRLHGGHEVSPDEWATHVARFRTYQTESVFRSGVSWMNSIVSPEKPGPLKEVAKPGALVGRIEYRPDGSKLYLIF